MIPVRLCDIDPQVRLAAARRLARREGDHGAVLDLLAAAASPSTRTYWISEKAARGIEHLLSAEADDMIGQDAGNRCSRHTGTLPTDPEYREAA